MSPLPAQLGRSVAGGVQRVLQSTSSAAAVQSHAAVEEEYVTGLVPQDCPVSCFNEWDPLEEVIVGRAENANVPPFTVEVKVSTSVKMTCTLPHLHARENHCCSGVSNLFLTMTQCA